MTELENFFLLVYVKLLANKVHNLRAECEKEVNQSALMYLGELESMIDDLLEVCKVAAGEDPCKD